MYARLLVHTSGSSRTCLRNVIRQCRRQQLGRFYATDDSADVLGSSARERAKQIADQINELDQASQSNVAAETGSWTQDQLEKSTLQNIKEPPQEPEAPGYRQPGSSLQDSSEQKSSINGSPEHEDEHTPEHLQQGLEGRDENRKYGGTDQTEASREALDLSAGKRENLLEHAAQILEAQSVRGLRKLLSQPEDYTLVPSADYETTGSWHVRAITDLNADQLELSRQFRSFVVSNLGAIKSKLSEMKERGRPPKYLAEANSLSQELPHKLPLSDADQLEDSVQDQDQPEHSLRGEDESRDIKLQQVIEAQPEYELAKLQSDSSRYVLAPDEDGQYKVQERSAVSQAQLAEAIEWDPFEASRAERVQVRKIVEAQPREDLTKLESSPKQYVIASTEDGEYKVQNLADLNEAQKAAAIRVYPRQDDEDDDDGGFAQEDPDDTRDGEQEGRLDDAGGEGGNRTHADVGKYMAKSADQSGYNVPITQRELHMLEQFDKVDKTPVPFVPGRTSKEEHLRSGRGTSTIAGGNFEGVIQDRIEMLTNTAQIEVRHPPDLAKRMMRGALVSFKSAEERDAVVEAARDHAHRIKQSAKTVRQGRRDDKVEHEFSPMLDGHRKVMMDNYVRGRYWDMDRERYDSPILQQASTTVALNGTYLGRDAGLFMKKVADLVAPQARPQQQEEEEEGKATAQKRPAKRRVLV